MSISLTDLHGSATIVNSYFFNDVSDIQEQVTSSRTSYPTTTQHREALNPKT